MKTYPYAQELICDLLFAKARKRYAEKHKVNQPNTSNTNSLEQNKQKAEITPNKTPRSGITKEIPPQVLNGFVFYIKDIQYNKTFHCDESCSFYSDIRQGSISSCDCCVVKKVKGSFSCIEVLVHMVATSSVNDDWFCSDDNVEIIDTNGYAHKGLLLCDNVLDNRTRVKSCDRIRKKTKADLIFTFSLLPEGVEIQSVLITENKYDYIRFEIVDEDSEDEYDLGNYITTSDNNGQQDEDSGLSDYYEKRRIREIWDNYKQLKINIFKRLNNELTQNAAQKLEEDIEEKIYSLNLDLTWNADFDTQQDKSILDALQREVEDYREALFEKKKAENKRTIRLKNASELLNISPFDFEFLCAKILENRGYDKIQQTPRSHDYGIDIKAESKGKIVVAQCKRYQSKVGSPDMQRFIGAVHNACADIGVFFTTDFFTKEAEEMAAANNIVLVNREQIIRDLSLLNDFGEEEMYKLPL